MTAEPAADTDSRPSAAPSASAAPPDRTGDDAARSQAPASTGAGLRALARAYAGPVALIVGVVLCVLGWYGTSGESVEAKQIPYLASASIPGAALIVAAAILLTADRRGGAPTSPGLSAEETARRIADLHTLLVEAAPADGAAAPAQVGAEHAGTATDGTSTPTLWALPSGTRYHLPACPLLAGKVDAYPLVGGPEARAGLTPCPMCTPPGPSAPDSAPSGG